MTDEGLREIQLNGKQLVFLFMAATVVAVVIFLCGVMVGRGVPVRAGTATEVSEQAGLDPTAAPPSRVVQAASAAGETDPGAAGEDLSYPALLGSEGGAENTLVPVSEAAGESLEPTAPPRVPTPATGPPAPRAAAAPDAPTPASMEAASNLAEPDGDGFVVQVAAVRQRTAANDMARRLSGKGYPAFVTTAGANYRVRVGKYQDRSEAETVARRLEREERVEPWITR